MQCYSFSFWGIVMENVFAKFTLKAEIKDEAIQLKDIVKHFKNHYPLARFALDENGGSTGCVHWDTHDHDIIEFSKLYPDIIFYLYVESCVPISRDPEDDAWEYTVKAGCDNYREPIEKMEQHKKWEAWMSRSRAARNRF